MSESALVELQQTLYRSCNPTRRWLHCSRRDWIIDAVRSAACEGIGTSCAVEVGPGSGVYLPVLAALYEQVIALDIEATYLQHAQSLLSRHRNLTLTVDDITTSRLPTGAADLVLCTEVIEHLADSVSALSEMRRILRPGGVLILSTPQRYSPLELAARVAYLPGIIQLVRFIYREPILESGHINLLTAAQVRGQLDQAGFHIQQTHKSGVYLPLVAEFTGASGLRFGQWLEGKLINSRLDWLLWTQYYIATAGADVVAS